MEAGADQAELPLVENFRLQLGQKYIKINRLGHDEQSLTRTRWSAHEL